MRISGPHRSSRNFSALFLVGLASLTILFHLAISRSTSVREAPKIQKDAYPCETTDVSTVEIKLLDRLKAIESKLDMLLLADGVTNATFTQVLVSLKGELGTVLDAFNNNIQSDETLSSRNVGDRISKAIESAKKVETVPFHERPKIRLFVGVFVSLLFQYRTIRRRRVESTMPDALKA